MCLHVWAQFQLVCYGIDKRMLTDLWHHGLPEFQQTHPIPICRLEKFFDRFGKQRLGENCRFRCEFRNLLLQFKTMAHAEQRNHRDILLPKRFHRFLN